MLGGVMRSSKRWVVGGLAGLALVGCTRDNADFGGPDDSTTAKGSTGVVDTDGATRGTTSVGEGSAGSTAQADTLEPTTADGTTEEGTTGGTCDLHPPAPIVIRVFEGKAELFPTPACDDIIVVQAGLLASAVNGFVHQDCPTCSCEMDPASVRLDLAGTLELPPFEECVSLVVWAGEGPDGCRWDGFAIAEPGGTEIPGYLAMNSRTLPSDVYGNVDVGLELEEACESVAMCAEEAGRHALTFFEGPAVSVGASQDVIINFFASADYTVTNRMASVEPECSERVAWTAQAIP